MEKTSKQVFVVMPFGDTPTRGKLELDEFYNQTLKASIESFQGFSNRYIVNRSSDEFDIGRQIVRSIYAADLVLCDLSGEHGNPNVMFELGLRLALTNKPVILFREQHESNRQIFDVSVYHTFEYSPLRCSELVSYLFEKISKFESGREKFESPVLAALSREESVIVEIQRSRALTQIESLFSSLTGLIRSFGSASFAYIRGRLPGEEPPKKAYDLLSFLHKHYDQLASPDWSDFTFQPHLPPSLHNFLIELPLLNATTHELALIWNATIMEYYITYFSTDIRWAASRFSVLYDFIFETSHICDGLLVLLSYLKNSDSADASNSLKEMLGYLLETKSAQGGEEQIREFLRKI